MKERIPLSLITGLDQSGKTTFIKELIDSQQPKKFALIENESGRILVDKSVVTTKAEGFYEMSNGCLYCENNQELFDIMYHLVDNPYQFDHLLLELADDVDPSALIYSFMTDCCIGKRFVLDGVISVVKATELSEALRKNPYAERQIAWADTIILDPEVATPTALEEATGLINMINPMATCYAWTTTSQPNSPALERAAFALAGIARDTAKIPSAHYYKNDTFSSFSLNIEKPIYLDVFRTWLNEELMFGPSELYRLRGVLHVDGSPARVIVDTIRENFICVEAEPWSNGEAKHSKIYISGRHLDQASLIEAIYRCQEKLASDDAVRM